MHVLWSHGLEGTPVTGGSVNRGISSNRGRGHEGLVDVYIDLELRE